MSGVPLPEIAVPPPKDDVPSPFFWGGIIKIVATRGQILRLIYTKFYFGWGFAPDPAGELSALPRTS